MRKSVLQVVSLLLALCMLLCSCGSSSNSGSNAESGTKEVASTEDKAAEESGEASADTAEAPEKLLYVVTGTLGDMSLGDLVMAALDKYSADYGAEVNVVELAYDASLYNSTLEDAAKSGEYDAIVAGFYNLNEAIELAAEKYPEQKFLAFDTEFDYSDGKNQNVQTVQALQNEGAFLAGALAALMTTQTSVEGINEDKVVGYVGAAENTAIQDFLIGYIEGVNYVDSEIEVLYSFVGDWTNSALAKELALTQFQQGADISFSVCGGAGLGVAEAAKDTGKYHIGVDYDMALAIEENNREAAEHIMSSCVKDLERLVYDQLVAWHDGTLQFGTHTLAGVKDGGMKMADNEYYQAIVPKEVQDQMSEIIEKLSNGEIEVGTAIGATVDEINEYKEQAKPF